MTSDLFGYGIIFVMYLVTGILIWRFSSKSTVENKGQAGQPSKRRPVEEEKQTYDPTLIHPVKICASTFSGEFDAKMVSKRLKAGGMVCPAYMVDEILNDLAEEENPVLRSRMTRKWDKRMFRAIA